VDIRFTGLRPGEKLSEELLCAGEQRAETGHPGVWRLQHGLPPRWETLAGALHELERAAARHDGAGVRAWLKRIVPEFAGVRAGDVAILLDPPRAARAAGQGGAA
jgi:FlaA1/EpsC-like NDP-sugar epimerase